MGVPGLLVRIRHSYWAFLMANCIRSARGRAHLPRHAEQPRLRQHRAPLGPRARICACGGRRTAPARLAAVLLLTAARTASPNCAASAAWCRSSSRDRRAEARDRRELRSEREVLSLQVFFGIQDLQRDNLALASRSCIQELPLLALDGQKVLGSLRCCCEVARCCRELSS